MKVPYIVVPAFCFEKWSYNFCCIYNEPYVLQSWPAKLRRRVFVANTVPNFKCVMLTSCPGSCLWSPPERLTMDVFNKHVIVRRAESYHSLSSCPYRALAEFYEERGGSQHSATGAIVFSYSKLEVYPVNVDWLSKPSPL